MLLRTMLLVAFVAVLGEAVVYGAASLARMNLHARENAVIRAAFTDGVRRAREAAIDGTIPQPAATCVYSNESGCAISVRTSISAPTPPAGATPAGCPSGNCTIFMQNNSHVDESRVSYDILEEIRAENGDVLVSRKGRVAFRTFATAPYAALVGSLDATLDALANGGVGDDGGSATSSGSTVIHVEYQQRGKPATRVPGDVWRALDEHPATTVPSWDR